jgi:hypothetical protein
MAETTHNVYFDGGVQSLGFEPGGARTTVGVIQPGTYRFDTDAAERMTVVAGALEVLVDGTTEWDRHDVGAIFEVPGRSGFEVRVAGPSAYLCKFL